MKYILLVVAVASTIFTVVTTRSVLASEERVIVTKAVAPSHYPPVARAARMEGKVKVDIKINTTGNVTAANGVEGHKLLQKVSEAAAVNWKFATSTKGSNERLAQLTFTFILGTGDRDTISFLPPYEVEYVARVEKIDSH